MQSWKEKKDHLCWLIKSISEHYGGDTEAWLREYCREVINLHKNDLDKVLIYFENLASVLKIPKDLPKPLRPQYKPTTCAKCGYVPPFCCCKE